MTMGIIQDGNKTTFHKMTGKWIKDGGTFYKYDQTRAYKYGDTRVCFFNKDNGEAISFGNAKTKQHNENVKTIRVKLKEFFGRIEV